MENCQGAGGYCVTTQEGFYTMSGVWLTIGALWFVWIFRAVRQLQTIEPGESTGRRAGRWPETTGGRNSNISTFLLEMTRERKQTK